MGVTGAVAGLSAKAIAGIIIGSVVVVGAVGGIAFAATDGFGLLSESPASSEAAPTPTRTIIPGERKEDGVIEEAWSMDAAFSAGKSVECRYSYEGYDGTATLRSKVNFRIDQQMQGGMVHVIRDPNASLVWVEGMTGAMEFDTSAYESAEPGKYPNFSPAQFEAALLDDHTTCVEIPAAGDEFFTLPTGMTAAPATP